MNDVFIGFGIARFIVDIPAQRLEKWIDKFPAHLCFVVGAGFVGFLVSFKPFYEIKNNLRSGHGSSLHFDKKYL